MKKLLIVESPSKIATISKFLGKDFKIMSTLGHIKDLPTKKLGVTITGTLEDGNIEVIYVPIEKKDKLIKELVKEASKVDEVYLAPDPDREGEIIAWHVEQEILKVISAEHIHRISFNEITKPAVLAGIANQTHVDMNKVNAQQARRILDRWVGYEVSPILWQKITKGLSAGRVQSVALKILCHRETEIRAFVPKEYWSLDGLFGKKPTFLAPLTHIDKDAAEINDEKSALALQEAVNKTDFIIESITDKTRTKNPIAPFITSTLQQAAANKLGFPVKKTMTIAQSMYEGIPLKNPSEQTALITYMRTDSTRLSETAIDQARAYIPETFGAKYLPAKANVYSKKGAAQDAHEAIRPIDVNVTPESIKPYVSSEVYKVYDLIWKRFVACQMTPAEYAQRQVVIKGGKFTFKVTGSTLLFDGFLKVYDNSDEENEKEQKVVIPDNLVQGQPINLASTEIKQHFTQAPPRYSEASLIKELEKQGIGRPSTFASIVSTLLNRTYATLDKKRFVPTDLGSKVVEMLETNLPKIMDTKFTALMEEDLDKIADGEMKRDVVLREFYDSFSQDLEKFKGSSTGKSKKTVEVTDMDCPTCGKHKLAVRLSKKGSFVGCTGFPECTFTSNFTRKDDGTIQLVETQAPALLEETCPTCTSPLRRLIGRFGPFTACSGYPKCKYIHQNSANFPCPLCNGKVVERKWRGGTIWGCQNYPKCKFSIFGDIQQTQCPSCKKSPYLLKKNLKDGTIELSCPDTTCKYKIAEPQPN